MAEDRILILYASQTGNAKSIAEGLHEEADKKQINTIVHCVNEYEKDKFPFDEDVNVLFVVSTTGEGEPPDHALKFWRKLKKKTHSKDFLKNISYTVLGLGDSNYTNFCNMGKMLDKRMRELGASPFYEPGFADDAVGLELVIEPWVEGLWSAIEKLLGGRCDVRKEGEREREKEREREGCLVEVVQQKTGVSNKTKEEKEETTLPPISTQTSPQVAPVKSEDILSRLANKPATKSLTSAVASVPSTSSSPPVQRSPYTSRNTAVKLSPIHSPNMKHLDVPSSTGVTKATGTITSPPIALTANQMWTGYKKGALKPIEGKSSDQDDLYIQEAKAPSSPPLQRTFLTPLEGRYRSGSLSSTNVSSDLVDDLEGTSSTPNLINDRTDEAIAAYQKLQLSDEALPKSPKSPKVHPLERSLHSTDIKLYESGTREASLPPASLPEQPVSVAHKIAMDTITIPLMDDSSPPSNLPVLPSSSEVSDGAMSDSVEVVESDVLRKLRAMSFPLDQELITPSKLHPYLNIECSSIEGQTDKGDGVFPYHSVSYGPNTKNFTAEFQQHRVLTKMDAAKTAIEMGFTVKEETFSYEPGDAFGFVVPNREFEVEYLIKRLDLTATQNDQLSFTVTEGTLAKRPMLPRHIPVGCTIRQYLKHCADIRGIPKKSFLFLLSSYTSSEEEKRRLEELSSKQGASDYTNLFIELHLDVVDVLVAFPSCQPPLQRLIENLPKLQPRYFSVATSPLVARQKFNIVFNVVELPSRYWNPQRRYGLCTGWLTQMCSSQKSQEVCIFTRGLNPFHLPPDPTTPLIMCGPGTGVAPFISFIQHIQNQNGSTSRSVRGESWLFYGCRHPAKDHIYRLELNEAVKNGGLTYYCVSYSRYDKSEVCYVQDNIKRYCEELATLIMERDATVYVCGDAKNMSKNIKDAFYDILSHYIKTKGLFVSADKVLTQMRENGQYVLDLWT